MKNKKLFVCVITCILLLGSILLVLILTNDGNKDSWLAYKYGTSNSPTYSITNGAYQNSDFRSGTKSDEVVNELPINVYNVVQNIMTSSNYDSYVIEKISEDLESDTVYYNIRFNTGSLWFVYETISTGEAYAYPGVE